MEQGLSESPLALDFSMIGCQSVSHACSSPPADENGCHVQNHCNDTRPVFRFPPSTNSLVCWPNETFCELRLERHGVRDGGAGPLPSSLLFQHVAVVKDANVVERILYFLVTPLDFAL